MEFKTKLDELRFTCKINSAILEEVTLRKDPTAQWWVEAVSLWHVTCNAGREEGGVLDEVFKDEVKRSTAQNNSQ
jgi:hypothetical protein